MRLIKALYIMGLVGAGVWEAMYWREVRHAAVELAVALILLGVMMRVARAALKPGRPDAMASVAWAVALYLAAAIAVLLLVGAMSMGYALGDDAVVAGILGGGLLVGLLHGGIAAAHAAKLAAPTPAAGETSPHADAGAAPIVAPATASAGVAMPTAGGVVFGLMLAIVLAATAAFIANAFRGPVVGVWELGTPRYARDQRPVDICRGLAVIVVGCGFGAAIVRKPGFGRGVGIGLLVGSLGLGLLLAMAK